MTTTQKTYAELEIGIHRYQADDYQVELRFTDPAQDNQAEVAAERGAALLDPAELLVLQHDTGAYGEKLSEQLFSDENIRLSWARTIAAIESRGLELRLRLLIGSSAPELHALRWELLQDPQNQQTLATSEKILFSRFMRSRDWRPVNIRPKAALKALVAVAAPSNIAEYQLAAVDRDGEIQRACDSLQGIEVSILGRDQPLTADELMAALRQPLDILYLVCHGALQRQGLPILYLQNKNGEVDVVKGADLARRVGELSQPPRLLVLASCESAAVAGSDATAALAPRLADAGVPAVLAMQGNISMITIETMMPVFFRELLKDGQIDRALAVARSQDAVQNNSDHWMPALFLRLKRGLIWYVPGFTGSDDDFEKWKSICRRVHQGAFIPILGLDVGEHVYSSTRELADRLAEDENFPLEPHYRSDLAKVTQYLSISQDRDYAEGKIAQLLQQQVLTHYPDLPEEIRSASLAKQLDAVVSEHAEDASDPFRILAQLPASIYITASNETLIGKVIKEAGRKPIPLFCNWRATVPQEPVYDAEPSPEQPLVHHVFGLLGRPDSLVLTEDDFFDYLIATSFYKLMPAVVRSALVESSLLFLGFRLDDWTFRVLFRLIMTLEGTADLARYSHVGVQIDPEEHSLADVERARRYLNQYFAHGRNRGQGRNEPKIDIYWGTAADFLNKLREKLDEFPPDEIIPIAPEETDDIY